MLFEVNLPALSPTMEEGKIVKWIKNEKDQILSGEVLFEVETDKATMEYESPEDGYVAKIMTLEGETANINQLVAIISDDLNFTEEDLENFIIEKDPSKNSQTKKIIDQVTFEDTVEKKTINNSNIQITPLALKYAKENSILIDDIKPQMRRIHMSDLTLNQSPEVTFKDKIFISPFAKKVAKEKSLEILKIKGSGPLDRIIIRDLLNKEIPEDSPKINKLRQAIAKATIYSKQNIPHFYLNSKVNMNNVLNFRKTEKQKGNKFTFNAILMQAIAKSFKNFQEANCTYKDNGEFIVHEDINIGIAVDTDKGLKMPVLKNINQDDLVDINTNLTNMIKIARDNKISPSDLSGGVISISNLGSFNIRSFDAIILPGQTFILAVGQIFEDVYVNKGKIEIANFLNLTLSCDHRAVDGVLASQFFSNIVLNLEKINNEQ
jgi:pyruvate dehydrogenase E2 component (dihydrolipoamide acetyltransferase)